MGAALLLKDALVVHGPAAAAYCLSGQPLTGVANCPATNHQSPSLSLVAHACETRITGLGKAKECCTRGKGCRRLAEVEPPEPRRMAGSWVGVGGFAEPLGPELIVEFPHRGAVVMGAMATRRSRDVYGRCEFAANAPIGSRHRSLALLDASLRARGRGCR